MKYEANKLIDIVQANLKENSLLKNTYFFQLKDRRVKVVFSENSNAPTVENALAKIAINRFG